VHTTGNIAQLYWIERSQGRLLRCADRDACDVDGGIVVVRDGTQPQALDGDLDTLYWTERAGPAPPDAGLLDAALFDAAPRTGSHVAKCDYFSCTTRTLFFRPEPLELAGIAVVGSFVYFGGVDVGGAPPMLRRCAKGSCGAVYDEWTLADVPVRLTSVQGPPPVLVFLAGKRIASCADNCDLAPRDVARGSLVSPAGSSGVVYFGDDDTKSIEACTLPDGGFPYDAAASRDSGADGGVPWTCGVVIGDAGRATEVFAAADSVYWAAGDAIFACHARSCTTPTLLAAGTDVRGFAFDGRNVYWSDGVRKQILRTPKL
jgi:hypothetical protein